MRILDDKIIKLNVAIRTLAGEARMMNAEFVNELDMIDYQHIEDCISRLQRAADDLSKTSAMLRREK